MRLVRRVLLAAALALLAASGTAVGQQAQPEAPRIEALLADGWEIAGYIAASDIRSLILFKHREHHYLVQCSVLVDAMRNPRLVTYCYELR